MSGRFRGLATRVVLLVASVTAALGMWKRAREATPATARSPANGAAPAVPPPRRPRAAPAGHPSAVTRATGTMFRGDPARRHRAAAAGPSEPRARFIVQLGGAIAAMPALSPEGDIVVATVGGRVARVSRAGEITWSAELGEPTYGSPLLTRGLVIAGTDGDRVVALSLDNGARRWSAPVDGDCDTSPVEAPGGEIVVAAGNTLYALGLTGDVAWRVKAPGKLHASPAVAEDGSIYVGSQDHHLYAVTPKGEVRWRRDLGAAVDCAAAVGERGLLYVGNDAGEVVALDREGSPKWRADVGGPVRVGLTVARDGAVVAAAGGPAPRIVALDGETGAARWSYLIPGDKDAAGGGPLEDAEGRFFFAARGGQVVALDPTGRVVWRHDAGGDIEAPLALGPDGTLYAGAGNGNLYAFR